MGTQFSHDKDVNAEDQLDERCCLLFLSKYNPYDQTQLLDTRTKETAQHVWTSKPATIPSQTASEQERHKRTTASRFGVLRGMDKVLGASGVQLPWAKATKPVFKQYGKLAVRLGTTDGLRPSGQFLRLNDDTKPLKFETSLFYGRVVARVKDAPGTPPTAYFQGVKRKMSVHLEGRFKKRICTNNVVVFLGFERKLVKLPALTKAIQATLNRMCKSTEFDLHSATPSVTAPLVALTDRIEVRYQGTIPGVPATVRLRNDGDDPSRKRLENVKASIQEAKRSGDKDKLKRLRTQLATIEKYIASKATDGVGKADDEAHSERGMGPWAWGGMRRVEENSALLGGVGRDPADSNERIQFFDKEKNRLAAFFEPDLVYSFDFFEQRMDLNTFILSQGPLKLDVKTRLNGQPINVELRVLDDAGKMCGTLFRIEFLHEDVCPELLRELRNSS